VFDTNFTADLTIIEEGYELLDRIENQKALPMVTSCSPGWINYMEGFYPDLIDNISTCKSPQQMFGTLSKTYYAEKAQIHPSKIFTVSVMPCTAKKFEAQRAEMTTCGAKDIDVVLTTRELARMLKMSGVNFKSISEEQFDDPFGITTGAAAIFGSTGGVMEAALRTVYEIVTDEELEVLDFYEVRGMDGIKATEVKMGDTVIKVAVAHSLIHAKKLMEEVRAGNSEYTFIEIMACPGGCIGGGGQPISTDPEIREKRMRGIYNIDRHKVLRKSHENPAIAKLYDTYLGKPNSHKAHELLHTHYEANVDSQEKVQ
jgi:NADH-quinone oxidoreductase subunit G/NADP-reducing hydrogenase subunit HndD